jgi:hypothetical protein
MPLLLFTLFSVYINGGFLPLTLSNFSDVFFNSVANFSLWYSECSKSTALLLLKMKSATKLFFIASANVQMNKPFQISVSMQKMIHI